MSTDPRATEIVEQLIREGNIDILEMLTRDDFMRDLTVTWRSNAHELIRAVYIVGYTSQHDRTRRKMRLFPVNTLGFLMC